MTRPYPFTVLRCLAFFTFTTQILALSAIKGSPCYDTCNGDSATSAGDIVCTDDDFENTAKGQLLQKCQTCLQQSTHTSGWMTDSILFLYYLSTVQQTCLSGKPAEPISNCESKCGDLSSAFSTLGGRAFFQQPFSYCSANGNTYTNDATECAKCLQGQEGTVILGNSVHVSNIGCDTQPNVHDGVSIYPSGDLFDTSVVNGGSDSESSEASASGSATVKPTGTVSPTLSGSASASDTASGSTSTLAPASGTLSGSNVGAVSATATATSASSSSDKTSSDDNKSSNKDGDDADDGVGGLSRGAAAGIGIAGGLLGIVAIVFLAFIARRRMLAKQDEGAGAGPWKRMADTPQTQQMSEAARGATPPAAGVFVPPMAAKTKRSKSFKSVASKSLKSLKMTPRTSEWYYAANPKTSDELSALPQKGWD